MLCTGPAARAALLHSTGRELGGSCNGCRRGARSVTVCPASGHLQWPPSCSCFAVQLPGATGCVKPPPAAKYCFPLGAMMSLHRTGRLLSTFSWIERRICIWLRRICILLNSYALRGKGQCDGGASLSRRWFRSCPAQFLSLVSKTGSQ